MRWFCDLKTRTKLFIGFGLLTALVLGAGLVGYQGLTAMHGSLAAMSDGGMAAISRLVETRSKLDAVGADLLHVVASGDRQAWARLHGEATRMSADVETALDDLRTGAVREDVRARIGQVQLAWRAFKAVRDEQVVPAFVAGRSSEALALATGVEAARYRAFTEEVSRLLDRLIPEARAQALRLEREGQQRYAASVALLAGLSGFAVFLGIALAFVYDRAMARPLVSLVGVLERVAAGDLTGPVEREPRDEVGQVALAARRMVEKLRTVMSQTVQHERLRALGKMASGAAHDLNNLLAIVLGHADLLLIEGTTRREALEAIRRAALDGREAVRRLQHFTVNGYLEEGPVWIDPCLAVEELIVFAAPQWKYQAQTRGVRYEIVKDLAAAPSIQIRPSALREVLLNLFLNALEAMPGGGRVGLRVRGGEDGIVIAVSDTGQGIPEPIRMCIFDPFFTTKPAPAGGLGLSICSRIISDLGGSLALESELGRGSTFAVRLPLSPLAPRPAPPRLSGARRPPTHSSVLLIGDERRTADSLAGLLRQAGHDVEIAVSGAAGVERYRNRRFDCVIADLVMPGLSGLTVSRAIKDHDPDAHVVLLTGWGEQVDANHSEAAGVDRVIMKPVGRDQIVQIFELEREASCTRS